ncbi:MAG: ion transporter [Lachnospiraceae bacterium]|nr:ion transporter [Lachnospiraceae bacterium]
MGKEDGGVDRKSSVKKRVFDIIQIGNKDDFISRFFDIFISLVIIVNIAVTFMETFDELSGIMPILKKAELITILIFCVEYALRIWTAEYLYPDKSRANSTIKFLLSFDGLIDMGTILPFFFLSGFVALRMLRVVRIFHLFRLNATYDSFNVITSVIFHRRNQIISSVFIIFILIMASSLCMYSAEHDVQPDVFDNAFSGIWWSVSTILTVGYGDMYPITTLGQVMAIIIAMLGVGVVAIPTGIISAGFVTEYTQMQREATDDATRSMSVLVVDDGSSFDKAKVGDAEQEYNMQINLIVRNGEVILPTNDTILESQDTICYQNENYGLKG